MEKVTPIIFVYLLSLMLIMGFAFGVSLVSAFTASSIFGVAWIVHSLFMALQVYYHLREGK
ncbi:MAG: hypothetical protein ACYDD5_12410 [Sulfuricurvum sp.]